MASLRQAEAVKEVGSSQTHLYKDSVSTELLVHGRVSPFWIPGMEELSGAYDLSCRTQIFSENFPSTEHIFFSLDSAF